MSAPAQDPEDELLETIERLEADRIAAGDYGFLNVGEIVSSSNRSRQEIEDLLVELSEDRQVLYQPGLNQAKSRTGHILRSLYHSRYHSQQNQRGTRNVSDLKYRRVTKTQPRREIDFDTDVREDIHELADIDGDLANEIFSAVLDAISDPDQFEYLSEFQQDAITDIFAQLQEEEEIDSDFTIVADTGAGKTICYQLPLILHIIAKKLAGTSRFDCSETTALLIFPRTMLAEDQYETFSDLCETIHETVQNQVMIGSQDAENLSIDILRDFGGALTYGQREEAYNDEPDVIITNPGTLTRRLMNPYCNAVYDQGIDFIVYDEIHLYEGLHGAQVASVNARLQNRLPNDPTFVGMSATIATPRKHCKKLFVRDQDPVLIDDKNEPEQEFAVEHHAMLRPRSGRPSLGVTVDATSCLMHNRRDNSRRERSTQNDRNRPKSICFVDSLDTTNRWTRQQNDLENHDFAIPFNRIQSQRFHRGYPIHFEPEADKDDGFDASECERCHQNEDVVASLCDSYQEGRCWYFSQDSADQSEWVEVPDFPGYYVPGDNVRFERMTSQEIPDDFDDVYNLFNGHVMVNTGAGDYRPAEVPIDALVATSTLEVGVDFEGIKEIVMHGEVKSPASYKQKAGRGAREGNLEDGLFVMSVVKPTPLANFYYRHFDRLVHPSVAPIPLEPSNPDALRAHAFCSILDYVAKRDIDIYNVINAKADEAEVERELGDAIEILDNQTGQIRHYLNEYLSQFEISTSEYVDEAIANLREVVGELDEPFELNGDEQKLIIHGYWAAGEGRDPQTRQDLEDLADEFEDQAQEYRDVMNARNTIEETAADITGMLRSKGGGLEELADELETELETQDLL